MIGSWSLRLNSNNNNKRQAILFCFWIGFNCAVVVCLHLLGVCTVATPINYLRYLSFQYIFDLIFVLPPPVWPFSCSPISSSSSYSSSPCPPSSSTVRVMCSNLSNIDRKYTIYQLIRCRVAFFCVCGGPGWPALAPDVSVKRDALTFPPDSGRWQSMAPCLFTWLWRYMMHNKYFIIYDLEGIVL